jgi:hypothetical protein
MRGYLFLITLLFFGVRHYQPAFFEFALLLVIVSLSKEGPLLAGSLANDLAALPSLRSPFAKAILMAMPVKTLTVMFGATSDTDFASVTLSSTAALLFLSLGLGVFASIARKSGSAKTLKSSRSSPWISLFDFSLIALLVLLGDDGATLFGSFAIEIQENLPFLREPAVRGMLAIVPVKTVSTLMLCNKAERRSIAAHGAMVMTVLAFLTFTAFWASSHVPVLIALLGGIFSCALSFVSLNTFKRVVREESGTIGA